MPKKKQRKKRVLPENERLFIINLRFSSAELLELTTAMKKAKSKLKSKFIREMFFLKIRSNE